MYAIPFPVIDPEATGNNIRRLRMEQGLSVRDIQKFFGFEEPRVIYMWQHGQCLPSVDNLYALSRLLGVSMDDILVSFGPQESQYHKEQQAKACCSSLLPGVRRPGIRQRRKPARPICPILPVRTPHGPGGRSGGRPGRRGGYLYEGPTVLGALRPKAEYEMEMCGGESRGAVNEKTVDAAGIAGKETGDDEVRSFIMCRMVRSSWFAM